MNNELERIRKEAVVAQFKVLCRHLSGGPEEHHEKVTQNETNYLYSKTRQVPGQR
jgi:hypothetical protein